MLKIKHAIIAAVAILGAATPAVADLCKTPKVKVVNDRPETIKVTKIQYYDGCDKKWRTEDVASTEIAPGKSYTFTDNLEYVGNCTVSKFKLYRALRQSTGSAYGSFAWGSELTPDEGSNQKCNTGTQFTIHAKK
jgi:hypothetical protein